MTRLKLWLGAAVAALLAFWGVWIAGGRNARQEARVDALEGDAKAQERMNEADIGIGAGDDASRKWLSDFAARNRR